METLTANTQAHRDSVTEIEAQHAVRVLLQYIGEDPDREGLHDTPARFVRSLDELTSGYSLDPASILNTHFDSGGYDEMVVCRGIEFNSTCEHHMLPFQGVACVGYIPKQRVVGLSKMARLVDCFARRLQIQEKMTHEIATVMQGCLNPRGVGVVLRAKHLCMSCRGVRKPFAEMVTCSLTGVFRKPFVRAEFLAHCQ